MSDARNSDADAGAACFLPTHVAAGTSGGGAVASGRTTNPGGGCDAPLEPPDDPAALVGRRVLRAFVDGVLYEGSIVSVRHTDAFGTLWVVVYDAGGTEDLDWSDLQDALQPEAPGAAAVAATEAVVRNAARAPAARRVSRHRDALLSAPTNAGGDAAKAHAYRFNARKLSLKEIHVPRPVKNKPRGRLQEQAHRDCGLGHPAAKQLKPKPPARRLPAKQQLKKQTLAKKPQPITPKKQLKQRHDRVKPRKAAAAGKKHVVKARAPPEPPKRKATAPPPVELPQPPRTQARHAAGEAAGATTRSATLKRGRSPVRAGPPGPLPGRRRAAAKAPRLQQQPATAPRRARQAAAAAGAPEKKPHRAAAKKARSDDDDDSSRSSRSSSQPPPAPKYTYNPFAPPPSPSPSSSSPSMPPPPDAEDDAMVALPTLALLPTPVPPLPAHEGGNITIAPPAAPAAVLYAPPTQLAAPAEARGANAWQPAGARGQPALASFLRAIRPPLAQLDAVLAALPSSGATLAHVDRIAAAQLSDDATDADAGGALKLLALKDLAGALGIRTACDRAVFATAALERGARRRAAGMLDCDDDDG
jgi:hypothetical protein